MPALNLFDMEFEISKETRDSTTECLRSFKCLNPDKGDICLDMCPVDQLFNKDILFLKDKLHDTFCHYKLRFGFSYICKCPARKEIYERYKK